MRTPVIIGIVALLLGGLDTTPYVVGVEELH